MFDEANKIGVNDEEKTKEAETLQLLVSAGYFRARIKGLHTFDKVIGGMTWCIQGCHMNIDIDLLFQDNWNIGKKIALTEKIVKALKKMNCPHRIEPHQIQGSDYEHIYPVVQWLVRKTLGSQDERMEDMKLLACQYFDRYSSFDTDKQLEDEPNKIWKNSTSQPLLDCSNYLDFINKTYWPIRKYRKPETMINGNEDVSVASTLLEYGKKQYFSNLSSVTKDEEDKSTSIKSTEDEEQEKKNMNEIQSQMSSQVKETSKMASKLVSRILEIKKDDLSVAVEDYQNKSTILMQNSQNTAASKIDAIQRAIGEFESQIEAVKNNTINVNNQLESLNEQLEELKATNEKKKNNLEELKTKIAESVAICPTNIDIVEVEELVKKLDSLKEDETLVKSGIINEDEKLNEQLVQATTEEDSGDSEEKVMELQEALNKEKKRYQNGRLKLASKTRELKQLELFLDNIPSKREIQQYQKRFVELNDQINIAYSENKQLYDMYNILDSVKDCLQREVNLLNSIYDNFKEAIQYTSGKEQMIKQMEQVANTIRDLKKNGEIQTEKTKADRDQKKAEYTSLLEQTREYARLTKQLQETWQLYEKLMSKAQEFGIDIDDL